MIINQAVDKLKWRERSRVEEKSGDSFVLSRLDTIKAQSFVNVDLMGYKQESAEKSQVEKQESQPNDQVAERATKAVNEGIGYLELMFGSDNLKLIDLNEQAKQFVEQEKAKQDQFGRLTFSSLLSGQSEAKQNATIGEGIQPQKADSESKQAPDKEVPMLNKIGSDLLSV